MRFIPQADDMCHCQPLVAPIILAKQGNSDSLRKRPETTFDFQAENPSEIFQNAQGYSWTRP